MNAVLISAGWVSAWGKVPCCCPGAADLLGVWAQVGGVGEHLPERQPRLLQPPAVGERLNIPNEHTEKVPSRRVPVRAGLRVVPVDQGNRTPRLAVSVSGVGQLLRAGR